MTQGPGTGQCPQPPYARDTVASTAKASLRTSWACLPLLLCTLLCWPQRDVSALDVGPWAWFFSLAPSKRGQRLETSTWVVWPGYSQGEGMFFYCILKKKKKEMPITNSVYLK